MKIIVFSGAGISKESGLDTFRKGGLWEGRRPQDVANILAWRQGEESRRIMLDFYNERRRNCRAAEPNAAHKTLADLEKHGHDVTVITQNIDDLHERGGSSHVIHLHGEIMKARSEDDDSVEIPWVEDLNLGHTLDGVQLRPHVVWFGEGLPEFDRAIQAATARDVDVLIVVGTTLEVSPANRCAFMTKAKKVYIVDPDPPEFWLMRSGMDMRRSRHPNVNVVKDTAVKGMRTVFDELVS